MKITIYLAMSVNGMISNKRGVPDWLSTEYEKGFMSITQQNKAVIMGKTTYNILAPDYLPLKDEGTMVVLTHDKEAKPAQSNVVFTDAGPKAIVTLLESRGHSEAVIIGGTQTVSAFLKAGLVNELIFVVEPKVFGGGGLPLLEGVDRDYNLVLSDVEKVNDNTVQVRYVVQS
jgi:dihydrofolate reductase